MVVGLVDNAVLAHPTVLERGTVNGGYFGQAAVAFERARVVWRGKQQTNQMNVLFYMNDINLHLDISGEDVSTYTSFRNTFYGDTGFNGNLNAWDTSRVTDMSYTFKLAENFNGNVETWDVSSVTNLTNTCDDAKAFNGDLSSWDVSNVENMHEIFKGAGLTNCTSSHRRCCY